MDFLSLLFIECILLVAGASFFLRRNNELLGVITLFTGAMFYRYYALDQGIADWVAFPYSVIPFEFTVAKGLLALNYMVLGTVLVVIAFLAVYHPPRAIKDNEAIFNYFLLQNKALIFAGFGLFSVINTFVQRFFNFADTGSSYAFLLGLGQSSFIILTFLIYQQLSFKSLFQKAVFAGVLVISAIGSYNPTTRFQFLGWMLALGIIAFRQRTAPQKLKYYLVGGVGAMLLFSVAGASRGAENSQKETSELVDSGWENIRKGEDINFIDGFIMVEQVYPVHLDYNWGTEQFGILLRPIPRQLWPGKPVGGWPNKLAIKNNVGYLPPVGISPTLYGSFYEDGGVVGIVLLSLLYGLVLARLQRAAEAYGSAMQHLIKGIILASLIALLRGGDLPGIYAFVGMSYWPIFIFLYRYNRFLARQWALQYASSLASAATVRPSSNQVSA